MKVENKYRKYPPLYVFTDACFKEPKQSTFSLTVAVQTESIKLVSYKNTVYLSNLLNSHLASKSQKRPSPKTLELSETYTWAL